jgi:hypothetical protein
MFLVDMTGSLNEILGSIVHYEKIFRMQIYFNRFSRARASIAATAVWSVVHLAMQKSR